MLDDAECRLGSRGNDRNWADRLYNHHIPNKNQTESENTRFSATAVDKGRSIFTVRHFAKIMYLNYEFILLTVSSSLARTAATFPIADDSNEGRPVPKGLFSINAVLFSLAAASFCRSDMAEELSKL